MEQADGRMKDFSFLLEPLHFEVKHKMLIGFDNKAVNVTCSCNGHKVEWDFLKLKEWSLEEFEDIMNTWVKSTAQRIAGGLALQKVEEIIGERNGNSRYKVTRKD